MNGPPAPPPDPVIYAPATGTGPAAITVVRLSGGGTSAILSVLCGVVPPPRHAGLRTLRGTDGEALDRAIVLWLPGPASYTGEDSAELHLHGGRAVLRAVSAALGRLGARPAEPGEFTRRALAAGRIDLLRAEGLLDLVQAETEAQRRQALRQAEGGLGAQVEAWQGRLLRLLAAAEAAIDFPDDVDEDEDGLAGDIDALTAELDVQLARSAGVSRLRDGVVVAVTGAPNVGKSALVNALAGRDAAIVSPLPGTTRDVVEVAVAVDGMPLVLLDTAGLRDSDDAVEREGVRRARERAASADLVVSVFEAGSEMPAADPRAIRVASKVDLAVAPACVHAVSALTGEGIDVLRQALGQRAAALLGGDGTPLLSWERHRAAVREVTAQLAAARRAPLAELRAESLRRGAAALSRLTGAGGSEEVLDVLFSRFCIGK